MYVSVLNISFLLLGVTFCAGVSSYYFYLTKKKRLLGFHVPYAELLICTLNNSNRTVRLSKYLIDYP